MDTAWLGHGRLRPVIAAILLVTVSSRQVIGQANNDNHTTTNGILNPYHAEPRWHLWTTSDAPVTVTVGKGTHTVAPRPRSERKFPVLPDGERATGMPRLATVEDGKPTSAGLRWLAFTTLAAHRPTHG